MSTRSEPKRFIAGAVCPRCGAQDRVRVFAVDGATHRDCVACGFTDVLEEAAADSLPQGRLDGPRPAASGQGQPMLFHPPKARSKRNAEEDGDRSSDRSATPSSGQGPDREPGPTRH